MAPVGRDVAQGPAGAGVEVVGQAGGLAVVSCCGGSGVAGVGAGGLEARHGAVVGVVGVVGVEVDVEVDVVMGR